MQERQFKKLDLEDLDAVIALEACAYPANTRRPEDHARMKRTMEEILAGQGQSRAYYGIFEDGQLLAQMCLLRFELNARGQRIRAGGIGSVATAILHRKRGAARDLLRAGLRHLVAEGMSVATLYPFRPGFYRTMGFGYGAEVRRYRVSPKDFPRRPVKGELRQYRGSQLERDALWSCYQASFLRTNGMISRLDPSMADAFRGELQPVVYEHEGVVEGYLVLEFEHHYAMKNDLVVKELVYNTPQALYALAGFLHRQVDQFEKIILETQDPALMMILDDVTAGTYDAFASQYVETYTAAMGMLYRVLDPVALFREMESLRFDCPNLRLRVVLEDDFLPENQNAVTVSVDDGRLRVNDASKDASKDDVELRVEVGTFSSLWLGAIDLDSVLRLGLASLSSTSTLPHLRAFFRVESRPQCWQHF